MSQAEKQSKAAGGISGRLVSAVCRRLRDGNRVRRTLPVWGRIHIDRPLPFLCIYRRPPECGGAGTERLVTGEPSYLICSGQRRLHRGLSQLVHRVTGEIVEQFGGCLLLELWEAPVTPGEGAVAAAKLRPRFRIFAPRTASNARFTEVLEAALGRVKLGKQKANVSVSASGRSCPRKMHPLLDAATAADMGCLLYGLEIAPVYRNGETDEIFPYVLRRLRHSLTLALRRAFFEFARTHTTHRPAHYHELGRHAVVKAVWDVDRMLAEASEQFDFLLQLTPINTEQAWNAFKRSHYQRKPVFHYRPLPAEPGVLKRSVYRAPVERIEDPALALIFREKVTELDRQITMLQDRGSYRCLHESIQLYGMVEDDILDIARGILDAIPPGTRERSSKGVARAAEVAARARAEIGFLREQWPKVDANVEIRPDIAGLIVSRGNLLVSDRLRVPKSRVEALIQHEIGTHVLTFYNGRAQPFRQLYTGLAGYEALQEGLAVLGEYLVGGLSRPRLRLLAARVLAVHLMIDGASFVDTYRALVGQYGFGKRSAFVISTRTYRGGGLTKDACYLRGFCAVLNYLSAGGSFTDLLVGKVATGHLPFVRELMWRGVLREAPLSPRYIHNHEALERLDRLRRGVSVMELTERKRR